MDDRRTHDDLAAERGDRPDDEGTVFPPATAMAGALAPVAGLAAVLTPDLAGGAADPDDESEEARAARIEADPPTDPSAPAR
jgi:hypothetical protein